MKSISTQSLPLPKHYHRESLITSAAEYPFPSNSQPFDLKYKITKITQFILNATLSFRTLQFGTYQPNHAYLHDD